VRLQVAHLSGHDDLRRAGWRPTAFALGRDHAVARGVNFIDTTPRTFGARYGAETFSATERIIGNWFAARPGLRDL
jgi:aryl-alcohol dehydrogenase-like predicted oxidoreductase